MPAPPQGTLASVPLLPLLCLSQGARGGKLKRGLRSWRGCSGKLTRMGYQKLPEES